MKEIALNTMIPNVGAVLAAVAWLSCCGNSCVAQTMVPAALATVSATGQTGTRATDPKREVASLLARARKAMSEADWETADKLIAQAAGLNVQFGKLHFGDTPDKARRDLERQRPIERSAVVKSNKQKQASDSLSQIPPAGEVLGPNGGDPPAAARAATPSPGVENPTSGGRVRWTILSAGRPGGRRRGQNPLRPGRPVDDRRTPSLAIAGRDGSGNHAGRSTGAARCREGR